MTEEQFKRLVARLELDADVSPAAYRRRTAALALVGFAYIFLLLGIGVGGMLYGVQLAMHRHTFIGAKLALAAGFVTFIVVRALWVPLGRPQGTRLTAADAPQLFDLVEKLRKKCGGPRLHEVLLVNELNAAICQTPLLGPLGWYRNSLIIGLPLMQVLSVSQFAAVIAHEFGHLAGSHGKVGAWIYRLRASWSRILDAFEQRDGFLDGIARAFLRWYIPYFQAYSFVLARQQEFDADRMSARVAGAQNAGDALVAVDLQARFLYESYWPKVWSGVAEAPTPPLMPFAGMSTAIKLGAAGDEANAWLQEALRRRTDTNDTHPCLRERLEALEHKPSVPGAPRLSAAQGLLQGNLARFVKLMDRAWWADNEARWRDRFDELQDARRTRNELADKAAHSLDRSSLTRLGMAHRTLGEREAALQVLRKAADGHDGTAEAAFHVGCMLLESGDERGIDYLELAMSRDGDAIEAANWRALEFYEQRDDEEKAERYRARLEAMHAET